MPLSVYAIVSVASSDAAAGSLVTVDPSTVTIELSLPFKHSGLSTLPPFLASPLSAFVCAMHDSHLYHFFMSISSSSSKYRQFGFTL